MKLLTQLIDEAKASNETDKPADGPINDNFYDFFYIYSSLLDKFKEGSGEERDVPQPLMNLLAAAYSHGAASALTTLKHGVIIRDEEGNVKDKAYFSHEELVTEARDMGCPHCNLEFLEDTMDDLLLDEEDLDDDEENSDDPAEEKQSSAYAEVIPVTFGKKHLH
jgi:hypothetical protein